MTAPLTVLGDRSDALPVRLALITMASTLGAQQRDLGIPQLRKQGSATQLVVDGKPFLILGGELGNSTASDIERMRPMWGQGARNEPEHRGRASLLGVARTEGKPFRLHARRLARHASARERHASSFCCGSGSWKNSMSSYVPEYVKTAQARFSRHRVDTRAGQESFRHSTRRTGKPTRAHFAGAHAHLRAFDGNRHTVLMVRSRTRQA
jgi:hypothetical protein